jgi:hypothetical protein
MHGLGSTHTLAPTERGCLGNRLMLLLRSEAVGCNEDGIGRITAREPGACFLARQTGVHIR